jgi:hypothetical protein
MACAFARSASPIGWVWPCALACAVLIPSSPLSSVRAQETPAATVTSGAVPFRVEPPPRSYVAIRRLDSTNERHQKAAWLVARTRLQDDGTFTWEVLEEGGSELIRKRVLREGLEKEAEVNRDGRARHGGLTLDNYTFSEPAPTEGGLRVAIEPRKREDMLVRGELLMSPEGELLRVEGELVKRPSFWTKSVHLIRQYGRVDGTRVPLRLDMVAQVRLVGTSRLTMTYTYLEINGRPVQDMASETAVIARTSGARAPER